MSATAVVNASSASDAKLKRSLTLWNLVIIGVIIIQPIAPMGVYGVVSNKADGHVVTTILLAMVAMILTAISYGRMARIYPSAGSAYTFVGKEFHPALGYVTGWSMLMDYMLNPLICMVMSSKLSMNLLPCIPFTVWMLFYAVLFTGLNLRGVKTSARVNTCLCAGMMVVVVIFFASVIYYLWGMKTYGPGFFTEPFYNPQTFNFSHLMTGTSIAVLTYIGFDSISTLSEEVENPRRNILLATVFVCITIGLLSALEVYAAQLVWGSVPFPGDKVESAFVMVSEKAGGYIMGQLINCTILVATIGSGMGSQLAAGRLLYGMGRGNALPKSFFGVVEPKHGIPRNNIVTVGIFAVTGGMIMELFSKLLGGGAYEIGTQALNFGAFIGFMGVNASVIMRYWVRADKRTWSNLVLPFIGIIVCGYIWLMLSFIAQIIGAVWMLVGITYGAIKTNGFRSNLITFEAPPEE